MFLCDAARSFPPCCLKNFVAKTACSTLIIIDSGSAVKYFFSLYNNKYKIMLDKYVNFQKPACPECPN